MADKQAEGPETQDNLTTEESSGQDEGSVLTEQEGTSKDAPSSTDRTATGDVPKWVAQLTPDLKENESLTKFQSIADLGKSYLELEGKVGKAVRLPDTDATAEEWDEYYKKIGRPENPDDYALDKAKVPKGYERSEEFDAAFRTAAFKNGLNDKQAAELYGIIANEIHTERSKPPIRISKTAAQEQLREELKGDYDVSLTHMKRAFRQFATPELTATLESSGLGNHPEIIKMFVRIGQMIGEPRFQEGIRTSGGPSGRIGQRSSDELAARLYPPKKSSA